jgi:hypothetical protein
MTSRVISREFAKGPLDLPLPREKAAFKDVFGSIRNIQAFRRLHDPIWLALHHCGHFVFELVIQKGRCRHQQNNGLIGDGDRYRQVVAARYRLMVKGPNRIGIQTVPQHDISVQLANAEARLQLHFGDFFNAIDPSKTLPNQIRDPDDWDNDDVEDVGCFVVMQDAVFPTTVS